MTSIRFSLLVYFLLLLGGALGAVSWYVYRVTNEMVSATQARKDEVLLGRYEKRRQDVEEKFDEEILHRAQTLASLAQAQFGGQVPPFFLHSLGLASSGASANSHLLVPTWVGEGVNSTLSARLYLALTTEIQFAEEIMPQAGDGQSTEYFQIYNQFGAPMQRSQSMENHAFSLDPKLRETLPLIDWSFDEVELKPGTHVRRVTLKAPVSRFRFVIQRPTQRPGSRQGVSTRQRPVPPVTVSGQFAHMPTPALFIQCASETNKKDTIIAGYHKEYEHDVAQLQSESQAALAGLRNRLLGISLLTFAAAVGGCFVLVRLGLSPLHRLSEAVSKVSEKDFRLQLPREELPVELVPIVDKLKDSLASLEKAFAREKQAAADISHELRTPISALLATVQVCLRKPRSSEEYQAALQTCSEISAHLSVLVERLLILARLDAGVDTLRSASVDVSQLAGQCISLLRPLADARGLSLKWERNGPAVLRTDPDKLRELLTNLLHNAIQYNRPHGSVSLLLERQNGQLKLEVKDTGVGIPSAAREHLFQRFYRVDPSRQSDTVHAGLGLAIVKGYLDLMGGAIEVESEEGKGSTFRVLLPAGE